MTISIAGRKVAMFRCHIDPMIGPKPRMAFVPEDIGAVAHINHEATGIIMTLKDGTQHFIFSANIQSCRLTNDEPMSDALDTDVVLETKRSQKTKQTASQAV